MEKSGIDKALEKAGGDTVYQQAENLRLLLGTSIQFIYNCRRKGWFPIGRARQISDAYGIPLSELVRADVRAALIANS
jgi:hypothetical protein